MDNLATQNHRSLRRLLMAIKASYGHLNLLISICDNGHYRNELIRTYEQELQAQNIRCDRLSLDRSHPSLKHSLKALVTDTPELLDTEAIVTILGADELLGVRLSEPKSAQEQFFFSVQWTREALREFTFPIVLWLTPAIASDLSQQAPDFWSWRGGVFEFSQPLSVHYAKADLNLPTTPHQPPEPTDRGSADPQDLEQQIQDLRQEDPESPLLASLYHSLGNAYKAAIRYSDAETAYRQALTLREQHLGSNDPDVATSLNELARVIKDMGRYSEAEPLYKPSLLIYEQQLGADHPSTATSLNNLAGLYRAQGRYSEAEPLYKRSLLIREEQLGADHPDTASSLNNLAELYRLQGYYKEAEPLYKRSLSIYEEQLGADHPDTATSLNNLAALYESQGRYSEAEPLYKRSLLIKEQQLGADHPSTATSLNNLAGLYKQQGRYSEAEPLYARAVEIFLQALGQDHPSTKTVVSNFEQCVKKAVEAG